MKVFLIISLLGLALEKEATASPHAAAIVAGATFAVPMFIPLVEERTARSITVIISKEKCL